MNLILSQNAFHRIERECTRYSGAETGGILLGKRNGRDYVVPLAVGPGPRAKRSARSFRPDVDWQQEFLDRYFEKYGLNYIGSFHTHIGDNHTPSAVDYRAALLILFNPDWDVASLVFPVVLIRGESIEIFPYYMSRETLDFEPIALGLVRNDHPCVSQYVSEERAA